MDKTKEELKSETAHHYDFNYPFPPRHCTGYWHDPDTLMSYDEAIEAFHNQSEQDQFMRRNPVKTRSRSKKADPNEVRYPFPPRHSMSWQGSNNQYGVSYDEAVAMFHAQSPEKQAMGYNPLMTEKQKQRQQEVAERRQRITEMQKAKSTPTIDPNNAYWPPYNPLAKDGEKQIEVIYESTLTKVAIFTPDEWKKLFELWDSHGDIKTVKDSLTGLYNARKTAEALGGLGVTAIVKNIDGVEYLFLSNYDKFEQTILHGGIFRADNARVVKMGLGALDSVQGMTRYVKTYAPAEFLLGSGINGLKYLLTDDYTLRELGVDQAKLLVNAVSVATLAYVLGVVTGATLSVPVASSVVVSLAILAISSGIVWGVDKLTDFQEKLVDAVIDEFDEK